MRVLVIFCHPSQGSFNAALHRRSLDALMHVEFIRTLDGPLICTALPPVRYRGEERLREIIDGYRALGVRVNNPHHRHVEDGRFGGTLPPASAAAKRRLDPLNLLNPGKLRVWPLPK